MPLSAQFVLSQIFLSSGKRLYLVNAAEVDIFLKNVLSSRIGVSSTERLDVKEAVVHRLLTESPSLPPATYPGLCEFCYTHHFIHSRDDGPAFSEVYQEGLNLRYQTKASLKLIPNAQPALRPKHSVPLAELPIVGEDLKQREQRDDVSMMKITVARLQKSLGNYGNTGADEHYNITSFLGSHQLLQCISADAA
ncbi:hypothetical protein ACTXT7_016836 [Hymenolepis weldensis]